MSLKWSQYLSNIYRNHC